MVAARSRDGASERSFASSPARVSRPWTVALTAVLAAVYAVAFVAVAAVVLAEFVSGRGKIGVEHLHGQAAKGVLFLVIVLCAGGALLLVGAYRLLTRRRAALLAVPFAVFLVVGAIGETVDAVGSASAGSNAVGGLLLVGAAVPLLLLASPRARRWRRPDDPRGHS